MTKRNPAQEIGREVAWVLGDWLRDTAVTAAVLISTLLALGAVLAGFTGGSAGWTVLGLVVGLPGMVLPFVTVARRWSVAATFLVCVAVVAVETATVVAVVTHS